MNNLQHAVENFSKTCLWFVLQCLYNHLNTITQGSFLGASSKYSEGFMISRGYNTSSPFRE